MPHAYFDTVRAAPRGEHQVLADARDRIRDLPTDHEGNLHVSDVLNALTSDA